MASIVRTEQYKLNIVRENPVRFDSSRGLTRYLSLGPVLSSCRFAGNISGRYLTASSVFQPEKPLFNTSSRRLQSVASVNIGTLNHGQQLRTVLKSRLEGEAVEGIGSSLEK